METQLTDAEKRVYDLAKTLDEAQPYRYEIRGERGRYHIYRTKLYRYKTREAKKIKAVFKTKAAAHKYMGKVEKVNEKQRQWSKSHADQAKKTYEATGQIPSVFGDTATA